MAKKKQRRTTKKKQIQPQHTLPSGFWAQVLAIALIALSILFVVAWLGAGGPVLELINKIALLTIGYGVYVLPILLVYIAIEIFRADENRLPGIMVMFV
jgi:hypothetical protein